MKVGIGDAVEVPVANELVAIPVLVWVVESEVIEIELTDRRLVVGVMIFVTEGVIVIITVVVIVGVESGPPQPPWHCSGPVGSPVGAYFCSSVGLGPPVLVHLRGLCSCRRLSRLWRAIVTSKCGLGIEATLWPLEC